MSVNIAFGRVHFQFQELHGSHKIPIPVLGDNNIVTEYSDLVTKFPNLSPTHFVALDH